MSVAVPANGAAPVGVLGEHFPFFSDFVGALLDHHGGSGVMQLSERGAQAAVCPACPPHERHALIVTAGPEGGWPLKRNCACSEEEILSALGGSSPVLGADTPLTERFVEAGELAAHVPTEPEWAWEGYLALGAVTVLAGKPKVGKSTLACALAWAVSSGAGSFLGRRAASGPVVYVSEEGVATAVPKLPDRGAWLLTREAAWPRPGWAELVGAAVEVAVARGAALLVVDTFGFWGQLAAERENDAGAVQEAVAPLVEATRAGLAVLLVHHARKAGGEGGDAVRGSSAIAGAADALLEVERVPGGAPSQRRLAALARWPQAPHELLVDRDPATGAWGVVQDAGRPAGRRDEMAERAEAVLREAVEPISGAEVARRLGRSKNDGTVREALKVLRDRGRAVNDGRGWGLRPADAATPVEPTAAEPGPERAEGVASGPDGNPGNPATGRRCQGGVAPVGGPADGNPTTPAPSGTAEEGA